MAKAKKIIEDKAKKNIKRRSLQPYEAIEPKIKELISMLDAQRDLIDATVKEYEDRQKAKKKADIKEYYDRKAVVLGDLKEAFFPRIFDEKWLNKTVTGAKYREEILEAIGRAQADVEKLQELHTPFINTVLEKYSETFSYEAAVEKNTELMEASARAGMTGDAPERIAVSVSSESVPVAGDQGILLKVYASSAQLTQITDFMKAIGVSYEIGRMYV